MRSPVVGFVAVLAAILLTFSYAKAVDLVPSDLEQGDKYHLVFVSTTDRDATSADIADYDAHVQAAADAAGIGVGSVLGDIAWKAIGSTPTVHAIDHIGVVAPVYRLDGTRVADGESDLWDGGIIEPVLITETGLQISEHVWTGTGTNGISPGSRSLGGSNASAVFGETWTTDHQWVADDDQGRTEMNHIYGISPAFTVVIPEPTTLLIWSLLTALGICLGWRRKR